jgi:hypothetical protein
VTAQPRRQPAPSAFGHLVGERLTVDMKDVKIVELDLRHRKGTRALEIVLWVRESAARGDRASVLVACADDRTPMSVLDELRQRELHNGCRYALGARRS